MGRNLKKLKCTEKIRKNRGVFCGIISTVVNMKK
nr:MAG TPA: hypothetical protein [Caudoviricetes sp.]